MSIDTAGKRTLKKHNLPCLKVLHPKRVIIFIRYIKLQKFYRHLFSGGTIQKSVKFPQLYGAISFLVLNKSRFKGVLSSHIDQGHPITVSS